MSYESPTTEPEWAGLYPDDGCEFATSCLACPLADCALDVEPPAGTPIVQPKLNRTGYNLMPRCVVCREPTAESLGVGRSKKLCKKHADDAARRQRKHKERHRVTVPLQ